MSQRRLLVIGAAGHSRVVVDAAEESGKYIVVGLIDRFQNIGTQVGSYSILGKEEDLPDVIDKYDVECAIIAIGDNWSRYVVYNRVKGLVPALEFAAVVHPAARIARSAQLGIGTVALAGSIVNSCGYVGKFCILNTKSSLDHDGFMDDFSSLAPNVTAGGHVRIGKFSALCLGVNVSNRVTVGNGTVIGAGSLVLSDIGDSVLAYGTPAKEVRHRNPDEKYL